MQISRFGIERLDEIAPLWVALREHHVRVASDVAPVRAAGDSWLRRRSQYELWLSDGSGMLFVAEDAEPIGYLMLHFADGPPTCAIGDRIAEVETLSVLESARGQGIGRALMASARAAARENGIASLSVALVHTNDGARAFYEREGFRPFYLSMLAPAEEPQ